MRGFSIFGKKNKKNKEEKKQQLPKETETEQQQLLSETELKQSSSETELKHQQPQGDRPRKEEIASKRSLFVDPITGSHYNPDSKGKDDTPLSPLSSHSDQKKKENMSSPTRESPPLDKLLGDPEHRSRQIENWDDPRVARSYDGIPVLEQTKLPRGGTSVETKAVGRVQFGIPPETIKDSMRLGIPVPQVYIVPLERFCREMGPALGVNLAEFEFPAYFNYFVYKKRCTLVVDSVDAEDNIRRVFGETLLGPAQFRSEEGGKTYEAEDFAPDFPVEAIPNFAKEFKHFRMMPDGHELVIETLLDFRHFELMVDRPLDQLGVPPPLLTKDDSGDEQDDSSASSSVVDVPEELPSDLIGIEQREIQTPWTYSNVMSMGDIATVWPFKATPEQKKARSVPRVEIFKMPGGTEYIVHDIDENNIIIGKARFSGHVKVSELMSVDGFGGRNFMDDVVPTRTSQVERMEPPLDSSESSYNYNTLVKEKITSFHPPSFGVTVLGNSHGFDQSGSVSGYVLWINGRGVMIDPPPYSSATLEREGIRPRTIVGIILTHCHADHDAGAFQKVLTGSPVVVITTPTIYKSFIRKYAALSALSPALLRHSHRYKPAIIGQPLRFQGATFHFLYTLHTIPCLGFRVEWRGRSMVFTGDHFNSPPAIDMLQETGVLSKARADDLRMLPLQETDLLLHEAGAPPIHTPLDVLLQLPKRVKDRLFVVHTSALPKDCELRVAPTGTAGTIRLDDQFQRRFTNRSSKNLTSSDEESYLFSSEYATITEDSESSMMNPRLASSFQHMSVTSSVASPGSRSKTQRTSMLGVNGGDEVAPPLVSLRPSSSTDAWFILNLLSAVPFLSSLSYSSTMELLETARVDAYSLHDVVVPAARRSQVLCVVWEGTCSERPTAKRVSRRTSAQSQKAMSKICEKNSDEGEVWHAGDWTGPVYLQPEVRKSGESPTSSTHDVVAMSSEGVKVITIDFPGLHAILKSGSSLYRRFLERIADQERAKMDGSTRSEHHSTTEQLLDDAKRELNVLELLNCNSCLKKLTAIQKRHLESLAVGPVKYDQGGRLWGAGTPVDKAFIIISGTASFVQKRRNAGSAATVQSGGDIAEIGIGMKVDAEQAVKELGVRYSDLQGDDYSSMSTEVEGHSSIQKIVFDSIYHEHAKLSRGLQKRAERMRNSGSVRSLSEYSGDSVDHDDDTEDLESQVEHIFCDEAENASKSRRNSATVRRRSSRARYENKVLGRLYSRRAFTGGLVFSRGHFLGDVSKMVAGLLSSDAISESGDGGPQYGFGDKAEGETDHALLATITERTASDHHVMHTSTLTAGKDGCIVLVFNKSSLIPFLDEYPGLLLSLLGTQVVV